MKKLPFVLWDLDGTLADTAQDIGAAANAALQALGRPPLEEAVIRQYIGEGAQRLMDQVVGEHEPVALRTRALELWREHYGAHLCVHSRPYPGIDRLVRRWEGRQAIVTNKPGPFARELVQRLGWDGLFTAVVGAGDAPLRKPAPDLALHALALSRMPAVQAVFIGDTLIDLATARAVGVPCALVGWGLRPREELSEAEVLLDNAESLESWLESQGA